MFPTTLILAQANRKTYLKTDTYEKIYIRQKPVTIPQTQQAKTRKLDIHKHVKVTNKKYTKDKNNGRKGQNTPRSKDPFKLHQANSVPKTQLQSPGKYQRKRNCTCYVRTSYRNCCYKSTRIIFFFFFPVNNHQNHVIQEDNDYHVCQEGKQRLATQATPVHYNP